jgi:hypothetical protein
MFDTFLEPSVLVLLCSSLQSIERRLSQFPVPIHFSVLQRKVLGKTEFPPPLIPRPIGIRDSDHTTATSQTEVHRGTTLSFNGSNMFVDGTSEGLVQSTVIGSRAPVSSTDGFPESMCDQSVRKWIPDGVVAWTRSVGTKDHIVTAFRALFFMCEWFDQRARAVSVIIGFDTQPPLGGAELTTLTPLKRIKPDID